VNKYRIVISSFLWLLCVDTFSQLTSPGGISGNNKYKVSFLSLGYLDSKSVSLPKVNFYLGTKKKEKPDYTLSDEGFTDKEGSILCSSVKVDRVDPDLGNRKVRLTKMNEAFCPVLEDLVFFSDAISYYRMTIFFKQFDEKTKSGVVSFKNKQYFIELPKDARFDIDSYFSTRLASSYKEAYDLFNNDPLKEKGDTQLLVPLYNAIIAYEKGDKSLLKEFVTLSDYSQKERERAKKQNKSCISCRAQLLNIELNPFKNYRIYEDNFYKTKGMDTILKIVKKQIEFIREYDLFSYFSGHSVGLNEGIMMHPLYQDELIKRIRVRISGHFKENDKYSAYIVVMIDLQDDQNIDDLIVQDEVSTSPKTNPIK